jgi:hypothetical protein
MEMLISMVRAIDTRSFFLSASSCTQLEYDISFILVFFFGESFGNTSLIAYWYFAARPTLERCFGMATRNSNATTGQLMLDIDPDIFKRPTRGWVPIIYISGVGGTFEGSKAFPYIKT